MSGHSLLDIRNVTKVFKIGGVFFGSELTAVDHVNLSMPADKKLVLSIVGESGSGKTTLARMILGIIRPTSGSILYRGKDIFKLRGEERKLFMKEVQPIFQNPYEAFNPLRKVDSYLYSTALRFKIASRDEVEDVVDEALGMVGLSLGKVKGKYPHEFSGGELQRVSIARALITRPKLLVADEPVSMVDATLRMSILNIFLDLKEKSYASIIYITHDLATAYYVSDYIMVMYRGNVMEFGDAEDVLENPLHPYTRVLLESLPKVDPRQRWREEIKLSGLEVKEFEALGCKFANRCPYAKEMCFEKRRVSC